MRFLRVGVLGGFLVASSVACSSSSSPAGAAGAPAGGGASGQSQAGSGGQPSAGSAGQAGAGGSVQAGAGGSGGSVAAAPSNSKIAHLVVIIQENHTFDDHFGRYCTAPAGSNPTCTLGPACCEAAPDADPSGAKPTTLDDKANATHSPDHTSACEAAEMDGSKMDAYSNAPGCGDPQNVAYGDAATLKPFWDMAQGGALADRYFQPTIGQSSSNDMYFARAAFVFLDNTKIPNSIGSACALGTDTAEYTDPTIGDLLVGKGVPWTFYAEGYQAMRDAFAKDPTNCPKHAADCKFKLDIYPCTYDPSDVPFLYYPNFRDKDPYMRDYAAFAKDLGQGSQPSVSFIKGLGFRTEHPGYSTTISDGEAFVASVVSAVSASAYAPDTLILVTYDEGGGYFDHITPPPASKADGKPYGTRVPTLALGPFARKNHVSHVTMEHSSVVKFIEWNWLSGQTGQLGTRDAEVNNIGSLLDPVATGTPVPEM